jgi:hypothetical protein
VAEWPTNSGNVFLTPSFIRPNDVNRMLSKDNRRRVAPQMHCDGNGSSHQSVDAIALRLLWASTS